MINIKIKIMNQQPILNDPMGRLLRLTEANASKRIVIGVVGLPGSGKSTLAHQLVNAVNGRTNAKAAVALSMDGFHLTKATLAQFADSAAALARRGSPWTFDPADLADKLKQLRQNPDESITWPDFQHGVGDPVADAITVNPATKLIIVEGLYLLHREHGWNLKGLLDECWYLDTPMDVAMERLVKRLLDVGAPGLLFPMVQTVAEAAKAVAATRYPPRGIRGVSGSTRANKFGRVSDYFTGVEDETAVLLQVETRAAVMLANQIGAVDGVSGVFFGPADIAADIGLLGQPMHKDVWDLILPAARKLMAAGIPVGTLVLDAGFARNLLDQGFSYVACGVDTAILAHGADALLTAMKA